MKRATIQQAHTRELTVIVQVAPSARKSILLTGDTTCELLLLEFAPSKVNVEVYCALRERATI